MPPRPLRTALFLSACLGAAGAAGACFSPAKIAAVPDTGRPEDAAADGGPSNLDGSCPECLPACEPTCDADAGCPFSTRAALTPGCAPLSFSLALAASPDGGPGEEIVSLCACGEAWVGQDVLFTSCARTAARAGPDGAPVVLVEDPTGTVRLFERNADGTWSMDEPPQIGSPAALAIDSSGRLHLAGLGQGAILHLVRDDGGAWLVEPAANAASGTQGLVLLALGPDDAPRIAFAEDGVQLATRTDAGWEHASASYAGRPLSLQVDARGRAHLLYLLDGVRYAMQGEDGTFVSELLDGQASAGALRLTGDGCPRAAWSAAGLHYGERTAWGWTSERVSDDAFGVADEPLALLPDGLPLLLHGAAQLWFSSR